MVSTHTISLILCVHSYMLQRKIRIALLALLSCLIFFFFQNEMKPNWNYISDANSATPDPGAISIQDKRSSVNGLGLVELCQVLGHLGQRKLTSSPTAAY